MADQNSSSTPSDVISQATATDAGSLEVQDRHTHPEKDSKFALLFSIWCAIAILLSAFLVFQIQPVFSKMILPWFGGSPAVWTACLMFFQLTLLAGYAYAFTINRLLSIKGQAIAHLALVFASLLFLPIIPADSAKPVDGYLPNPANTLGSHFNDRFALLLALFYRAPFSSLVCSQTPRKNPLSFIRAVQRRLTCRPAELSIHH